MPAIAVVHREGDHRPFF